MERQAMKTTGLAEDAVAFAWDFKLLPVPRNDQLLNRIISSACKGMVVVAYMLMSKFTIKANVNSCLYSNESAVLQMKRTIGTLQFVKIKQ